MEQVMPNWTLAIQAVIFLLSLLVIKKLIIDPISGLLRDRTMRIEGTEQEARRLAQEAQGLDAAYQSKLQEARAKAAALRHEARQQALTQEKEILSQGREKAHKVLEDIRSEIEAERARARAVLREQARELSVLLTEKVLGRKVQ